MSPFFGLRINYRQQLHSQLFDLIFHGNGGFTWSDVYHMPIWARKFYINKIIEFNEAQKKANEESMNKSRRGTRK